MVERSKKYKPKFTDKHLTQALYIIVDELKRKNIVINEYLLKHEIYFYVIRSLYDDDTFLDPMYKADRDSYYIRGKYKDIWNYLMESYDLIHNESMYQRSVDLGILE